MLSTNTFNSSMPWSPVQALATLPTKKTSG
jgi:hypothetical protein